MDAFESPGDTLVLIWSIDVSPADSFFTLKLGSLFKAKVRPCTLWTSWERAAPGGRTGNLATPSSEPEVNWNEMLRHVSFSPPRRWSITTTAVCWHRKQQVDVSGLKSCNSICRPCDKSAPTARLLRDKSVGKCDKTIRKIAFLRLGSSTRFEPNLWDHVRQWSTCVDDALSAFRLWVHLLIICSPFSLIDTMNRSLPLPRYTRYTMVTHLRANQRICWYTLALKVSSIHFKSVICNEIKFDLRSEREPSQL